ncbi:DEAD/DEAH box helicase [Roseateles sp. DAIF2]|uniref:DEAD/DEAH box helicase n=1 Tax=Roseateles sp. DAIF2 TaxID=2714952 RepID=UPI0018A2C8F9|nr:DEAD/DEAH box helicase [Roseateles sp. DAIF2]QPF74352.1 DEAD/DEAH box helicase [Roseateles sp. DAIF2]
MSFAPLGLEPALLKVLSELDYQDPTPIQAAAIPPALAGRDLLGQAATGAGKTLAFGLPLLQRALQAGGEGRRLRALVLAPTRELAAQIAEALRDIARLLPGKLKISVAFGGVSINPQLMGLRGGCDVLVATPGRLLDLVEHNALRFDALQLLVLDEADRLLDMGFADELQRILALLPARRQNLFFSATFPPAVQALADGLLREPLRVEAPAEAPPDILQRAIQVDEAKRTPLLRHLLASEGWSRLLVFVATQYATELVSDKLWKAGIKAAALHGELSQGTRREVLAALKAGTVQVLVATDVAARGLDIPELPAVLNYDLPRSPADYTHRIGRTGRAGASGVALSFVPAAAEAHFRLIEKRCGARVPREQIAGFEPKDVAPAEPGAGGIKSKTRKSKKDKLREAAVAAAAGKPPSA